mgnify:CR=1 FL=1
MTTLERKFAQTVAEHKSTIYTVCYMFSQDADEVNDLFQEVLVNLWKGFENFEHRSDIKTWIYRVALNTCISLDRKKRRSSAVRRLWTSTSLKTATKTPAKWTCSTSESPVCNPSTVLLSCSGLKTCRTRRSARLSVSLPKMSVSVCLESESS